MWLLSSREAMYRLASGDERKVLRFCLRKIRPRRRQFAFEASRPRSRICCIYCMLSQIMYIGQLSTTGLLPGVWISYDPDSLSTSPTAQRRRTSLSPSPCIDHSDRSIE